MRQSARVEVVIPALDEEQSIGLVLDAIPSWVDDVVVVDNGSTDATAERARRHRAHVVHEPRRGYGAACLAGLRALHSPDVVVFLDADFSDYPEEMGRLVDPIVCGDADFVLGAREVEPGSPPSLGLIQRLGNRLACALIHLRWRVRYRDLGPFRAIRRNALEALDMRDPGFGWTVEMQIAAARARLRTLEVPTRYRRRIGRSKISGTLSGAVKAGCKILYVIASHALSGTLSPRAGRGSG